MSNGPPLSTEATVVGGGLAGCEAAWQLARGGFRVSLVEMKPASMSPAHTTPLLAELVCSNSMRSNDPVTPAGLLKHELRRGGSLIISCADATRVPAGDALAIDRHAFSRLVTTRIALEPRIRIERRTVEAIPIGHDHPVIVAGGPLVGAGLARAIRRVAGDRLYFYDAIAPVVEADSIDMDHAFLGSRYGKGVRAGEGAEGDYVNCPLDRDLYYRFVDELRRGRSVTPHSFEEPRYFEGCLPVEVMADRGDDVLAFGPMKPVGLRDARRPSERPFAVVQLRAENRHRTSYNMVGFQTRLAYPEQRRIFSLIPALRRAVFLRYGSIHRNAYLESHRVLDSELRLKGLADTDVSFAGQITGVEGYIESTAIGLLAAWLLACRLRGGRLEPPPPTTAIGGLFRHVTRPRQPDEPFQPMNINFGLLPPLDEQDRRNPRRVRRALQARRAIAAFDEWLTKVGMAVPPRAAVAS